MPERPFPPPPPPTRAERLGNLLAMIRDYLGVLAGGRPGSRLRRPALYVVVGVSLVAGLPALGIPALLLLALTDALED